MIHLAAVARQVDDEPRLDALALVDGRDAVRRPPGPGLARVRARVHVAIPPGVAVEDARRPQHVRLDRGGAHHFDAEAAERAVLARDARRIDERAEVAEHRAGRLRERAEHRVGVVDALRALAARDAADLRRKVGLVVHDLACFVPQDLAALERRPADDDDGQARVRQLRVPLREVLGDRQRRPVPLREGLLVGGEAEDGLALQRDRLVDLRRHRSRIR